MQAASHGGLLFHARVVEIAKVQQDEDARHVRDALLRRSALEPIGGPSDVRYWHLADMPSCTAHVRFWG